MKMCISHVSCIEIDTLYETQCDLVRSPVDEIVHTWEVRVRVAFSQMYKGGKKSLKITNKNKQYI